MIYDKSTVRLPRQDANPEFQTPMKKRAFGIWKTKNASVFPQSFTKILQSDQFDLKERTNL